MNPPTKEERRKVNGPRDLKDPRSREYAIQAYANLSKIFEDEMYRFEDDRYLPEELADIEENECWRPMGYPSYDAALKAEIGHTRDELKVVVREGIIDEQIRRLAQSTKYAESDVSILVGHMRYVLEHGHQRIDDKGGWVNFCKDVIGYDASFLDTMEQGVSILEKKGHQGPITKNEAASAVAAARNNPMPLNGEHGRGRPKPSNDVRCYNVTPNSERGNNKDYILRRLARDNPQLLDKVESGELSARCAGIAAGFIKVDSGLDQLRKAWRKASEAERQAFAETFSDELTSLLGVKQ